MADTPLDERSRALSDRVDALAAALREAGVSPEAASRVLASAASATLDALTLELLLERPRPAAATLPSAAETERAAPAVRLAA